MNPQPRLLFLNRFYWPDQEATGRLLTDLCEDLSHAFDVVVVASQPPRPTDESKPEPPAHERRNGVEIRRVFSTRLPKQFLLGRLINLATYLLSATCRVLLLRKPSLVVVQTDPPLLCLLGAFLKVWWRCRLVVYVQDLYPDVAIAMGKVRNRYLAQVLKSVIYFAYRRADLVFTVSEDMREPLLQAGVAREKITCISNWADTESIHPRGPENRLRSTYTQQHRARFIVMYSGNMGLTQNLDGVLDAAELLRDHPEIGFVLVGNGAMRDSLEQQAQQRRLANVRFVDFQPENRLAESLSAADLQLVLLAPQVQQFLMPSKLYGALAAGCPVIAFASASSELAKLVVSHRVGKLVPDGDSRQLADSILWCFEHPAELQTMAESARKLAVDRYDRQIVTSEIGDHFMGLLNGKSSLRNGDGGGHRG